MRKLKAISRFGKGRRTSRGGTKIKKRVKIPSSTSKLLSHADSTTSVFSN
jgi:hypothetical protein